MSRMPDELNVVDNYDNCAWVKKKNKKKKCGIDVDG